MIEYADIKKIVSLKHEAEKKIGGILLGLDAGLGKIDPSIRIINISHQNSFWNHRLTGVSVTVKIDADISEAGQSVVFNCSENWVRIEEKKQ